ncbi:MAG: hypothetical protein M3Q71_16280 [Chloroflexota bacterium]|nr:hypothetical protein [Chloroflexota bacterium]
MDTITERAHRQHVETLRRLATKAERAGTRVLRIAGSERHVATSGTHPVAYEVSVEGGCTCRGYSVWHRCGHHALLLSELGLIPDVEDVVIVKAPAPCRSCRGSGFVRMTTGPALSDWVMAPCTACTGQPAPSPSPVAVCAA